jgi:1,4-alpha-glucan branching enzyme
MKKVLIVAGATVVVLLAVVGVLAILAELKSPEGEVRQPVVFRIVAPEATAVFVTGSFNAWRTVEHRLERKANGIWETTVPIAPGRYEYKFVVDSVWVHDMTNPVKVPAPLPFVGYNSVLEVRAK